MNFPNKFLIILILILALFLRVWGLDKVPVSLFGDEVDVGYHAYSLLKTGKDYSGNFLPLRLRSLADSKNPLYSYSIIPTVAMFGISPLGVRLPAALFGVLGIYLFYLLINLLFKNKSLALLCAFLLTISPWHIHYSRWGFEGTEMLAFYLAGFYCFMKSFNNFRLLILAAILFGLTPAVYHSAEVFVPLTLIALTVIYRRQINKFSKKTLLISTLIFILIVTPFVISTLFGGGIDRFKATSIFNSPTISGELGADRVRDSKMYTPSFLASLFHNKITYYGRKIITNYLQSFSTEFLFISGDPEPTHTPSGSGEFYKFEAVFMALGLVFLFLKTNDRKAKIFFVFWLMAAPLPSILTDHGGFHASRLLFLLPPLTFLIALGIYYSYFLLGNFKRIFLICLSMVTLLSFIFFEHNYWTHYPWDSQRWWHAGFEEAIKSTVLIGQKYDKVIISGADEPPLIFFLGWSQFPPSEFQHNYPFVKVNLEGIGEVSKLNKYYFPPIGKERGLYELGSILPKDTLYLATAKEIKLDLIKEPGRVPSDLTLIKSFSYPSSEPAFYLFTKNEALKRIR